MSKLSPMPSWDDQVPISARGEGGVISDLVWNVRGLRTGAACCGEEDSIGCLISCCSPDGSLGSWATERLVGEIPCPAVLFG